MPAPPILVTGAAGFVGFHVARVLLVDGRDVVGIDNLNAYYDPKLKEARLAELARHSTFRFRKLDLNDRDGMAALFAEHRFAHVVHLAAQAGVRRRVASVRVLSTPDHGRGGSGRRGAGGGPRTGVDPGGAGMVTNRAVEVDRDHRDLGRGAYLDPLECLRRHVPGAKDQARP